LIPVYVGMTNTLHGKISYPHLLRRYKESFIMKYVSLLIFVSCFALYTHSSLAAIEILESYHMAQKNDAAFNSARYEYEAAQTMPAQGLSYLLPSVEAHYMTGNYDTDSPTSGNYSSCSYGATLRQPVFNMARIFEYTQHKVRADLGKAKFTAAESDLIIRTATVYFDVLAARDKLEIVEAEKRAVAEQLEQAKRLFKAGAGTITDIHDALARYNTLLADEIEAKNNININVKAFKRVTGVEPKDLCPLKETIPFSAPSPDDLDGWIEIAKKNNPIIKYYYYNVDFYKQEHRKMTAQYFPNVDIVADHHTSDTIQYYRTEEVTYDSVMVQITLPLFQGGYTRAKTKEAAAKLEQAKADFDGVLSENAQKISEAFLGIKGNMALIQALEFAVQSAEISLQSNKMGLKAGIRTIVDILNAQRQLYHERMSLLKTKYDYIINFLKLKSEAGVLSEEDLAVISEWLQKT